MNQLIVLDYNTSKVHMYIVDPKVVIDDKYVFSLGFKEKNIYYMCGKLQVIKHKGILQ